VSGYADVRGFYAELGVALPDRGGANVDVRCFANPAAHAHGDRKASCSVSADRGIYKCHTCGAKGNAYQAALALGRTPADATALLERHGLDDRASGNGYDPMWTPRGRAVAVYTYQKRDGTTAQWVFKTADKQFPQAWPDPAKKHGKAWRKPDGFQHVLYKLPDVVEAIECGATIYVCEGEKDVDSAVKAGLYATCNPGGAGKWWPSLTEQLRGASRVVIVADNDEAGNAHARRVKGELRAAGIRCQVVRAAVGSDLTDHLNAEKTVEELVEVEDDATGEAAASPMIVTEPISWLERASDLLAEPDPGPTPFLVDELIGDQSIAALYGPAKASKTWLVLELSCATVTGRPALGYFKIPKPGPVIVVLEESGRAALWRRLDMLLRGSAQNRELVRDLHVAANRRVRLNDTKWQEALLTAGQAIRPRAIFLDPLARLKGAGVDENAQKELGPVLDFMRDLRDETCAAVAFTHHVGHEGNRMRGSSDLDGYWESAIKVTKGNDGQRTMQAEHREAEASPTTVFRADFDPATRSVRLNVVDGDLRTRVAAYLADHPAASANDVVDALGANRQEVLRLVKELRPDDLA
jgi:hypothetical protein